ncbi:GTP pyrophosphokinase [Nonlabens ulvanivorans]|nr:GTP pyrophosphokinase [Nonlabens ulvanivorans]
MVNFFKLKTSHDLFYRVGLGSIDNKMIKEYANSRSNALYSFIKNKIRKPKENPDIHKEEVTENYDQLVFGKDQQKLDYSFSKCCSPLPGDSVFGFITVTEGIKVHKNNCPNAISMQSKFAYRIMSAKWIDSSQQEYRADVILTGIDRMGLVQEVTRVISENMHVNIRNISFTSNDGIFKGEITVVVPHKNMLIKLMENLNKLNGIDKVTRV